MKLRNSLLTLLACCTFASTSQAGSVWGDDLAGGSYRPERKSNTPYENIEACILNPSGQEGRIGHYFVDQGFKITVIKGENLSVIAEKLKTLTLRGDISWYDVWLENKKVIGSNPNLIKPGMVLTYTTSSASYEVI